ncbi:MAG: RDD family protein [Nitrospirota bacterium]
MTDDWNTSPNVPSFADQAAWTPTPQAAGFFRRVFATVADICMVSLLYLGFLALGILGASLGAQASGARYLSHDLATALAAPFLALWLGVSWVYIGLFTRHGGQTPGKMLLRIRVVSLDGGNPSWGQALLRPIGYLISWLPLGLGFLLAAVPPAKRALHDRLTGTRVITVSRRAARAAAMVALVVAVSGSALAVSGHFTSASAVVVDQIVATANNRLITLSDLAAYQTVTGPLDVTREDAVQALIDRQLLLEEADRFAVSGPPAPDVASRIDAITTRVGGREELTSRLTRLGWEMEDLQAWMADDLRVAEFLDQRIYFFVLVPAQDVDAYYESHLDEFAGFSLEEARAAISKRLTQERGDEKRDQFLSKLREKTTIRINPLD